MAYSIGSDKLEKIKSSSIKARLTRDDERKLTGDMRELYDRLLPSAESDTKRKKFVQKLEKLLNDEWPGHDIQVHMFGSSGNLLCTDESDGMFSILKCSMASLLTHVVDICITTEWKELEGVCMLAEVLAKRKHINPVYEPGLYVTDGMEKVICVSTAKVPIVKVWDPELCLACDMNVNNTLALENTRMIKTYVQIDDRVRPLAMIIKYWTKRRAVNDAGTSYSPC
jgi:DNA polymerase sigma